MSNVCKKESPTNLKLHFLMSSLGYNSDMDRVEIHNQLKQLKSYILDQASGTISELFIA